MNIKQHTSVDIKFEDVPDECKIYTYLHSQATVLYYNSDKCTIWDEHDNVRLVFSIYLDANKEELQKCNELFNDYIRSIKSEKPVGLPKSMVDALTYGTGQWRSYTMEIPEHSPIFIGDSGEEWDDIEIDE